MAVFEAGSRRWLLLGLTFGLLAVLTLALGGSAGAAGSSFDDFESGLSQWTGKFGGGHNGEIAADPVRPGNGAVRFGAKVGAGDIFGPELAVSPGAAYTLSFEYLGTTGSAAGFAGYAETPGGNHRWLAGVAPVGAFGISASLVNDGQWHKCTVTFNSAFSRIRVMLEDFVSPVGASRNAYFDNVGLAPTAAGDATGCTVAPATSTITLISGNGPVNTLDPLITLSRDGGLTFPEQARISPKHPAYAGPIVGTQYIYCDFNHSNSCGIGRTHRYRQAFTLPVGFTAPSLTIEVHADNAAVIYLNGVQIGSQPVAAIGLNFQGPPESFTSTNASLFQAGSNNLDVDLVDLGGAAGLDYKAVVSFRAPTNQPPVCEDDPFSMNEDTVVQRIPPCSDPDGDTI